MSRGGERLGQQARQGGDILRRGLRQYSMPEVEHERPAAQGSTELLDGLFQRFPANDEQYRIEIALHDKPRLQPVTGKTERHGRIEADRVDPDFRGISFVEKPAATRSTGRAAAATARAGR